MKNKPLVLITDRFDFLQKLSLPRINSARCLYRSGLFKDMDLLKEAEALVIRTKTKIDKKFLKKTPSLKFILTGTSGFDHIDLQVAGQRGIRCFHLPEVYTKAVSEMTFLMILSLCRRIPLVQKQIQEGSWQRELLVGEELGGQRLGLIGFGRIGQSVARKAKAFGMEIFAFDPYIEKPKNMDFVTFVGLEELMKTSDIVSLHVPKTKKTCGMINRKTLQWMGSGKKLINLSRGAVVDQKELVEFLVETPLFMAGLDVFESEPIPGNSPLLKLQNVLLTPHIGGSTEFCLREASRQSLKRILNLLNGEKVEDELPPKASWYGECLS